MSQPISKLDNPSTLLQSVSSNAVHEKITILPGHEPDYSACTFALWQEDHTLGNALRWIIMKDPEVEFCGYTAPHPSEPKIHLRIQMYENQSAVDCLRRALSNLRDLLNAVNDTYSSSLQNDDYVREDDYDVKAAVDEKLRERGFAVEEDDRMDVS
ncbi:DNA-directed RNA polymerase I and III subunit RPAC2 [Cryptococcus neoformans A2-102-5]|nr:DNA-directed RNA polymerase I and III subunit RPAC2 [Cryptococcus neoformans var. grubii MW-RSA36]OXG93326.1 DNA-directed RNA polymerase I and III subunit RPAC2 [Cryptococcus neoformans var. grubii D17-1]OXG98958.1 DNA-directed RNA polymerase I and III subunit RPAC2 [Cryptococcus neoformans var. grubii A2-102-5]OXL10607.1 DNA-directed RNA polymerase I and III subunit RPAC2 [Cryptococcus neoformans var. grubii Gb118]